MTPVLLFAYKYQSYQLDIILANKTLFNDTIPNNLVERLPSSNTAFITLLLNDIVSNSKSNVVVSKSVPIAEINMLLDYTINSA